MQENSTACQQMGFGLKFLVVNYQLSDLDKAKEEKYSGLIPLFMKATIPGTYGI